MLCNWTEPRPSNRHSTREQTRILRAKLKRQHFKVARTFEELKWWDSSLDENFEKSYVYVEGLRRAEEGQTESLPPPEPSIPKLVGKRLVFFFSFWLTSRPSRRLQGTERNFSSDRKKLWKKYRKNTQPPEVLEEEDSEEDSDWDDDGTNQVA